MDGLLVAFFLPVLWEMKWRRGSQEGTLRGGGFELKAGAEENPLPHDVL